MCGMFSRKFCAFAAEVNGRTTGIKDLALCIIAMRPFALMALPSGYSGLNASDLLIHRLRPVKMMVVGTRP